MTCSQCAFLLKNSGGDCACRRYPPQITVMPVTSKVTRKTGLHIVSSYPPVADDLPACGDLVIRVNPTEN